jgi:hypothetical protein
MHQQCRPLLSPYRGQASADRQLAGDEIRPTRRATGFGIVVGEPHPFGRKRHHKRTIPRLLVGDDEIQPVLVASSRRRILGRVRAGDDLMWTVAELQRLETQLQTKESTCQKER